MHADGKKRGIRMKMLIGDFLPVLMSWMVLMQPLPAPLVRPPDTDMSTLGGHQPHLSSPSGVYSVLLSQLQKMSDSELDQFVPQLTNLLIDELTADAMHSLSAEQSHAVGLFEHFLLKRCAGNVLLGFKVNCAIKVRSVAGRAGSGSETGPGHCPRLSISVLCCAILYCTVLCCAALCCAVHS